MRIIAIAALFAGCSPSPIPAPPPDASALPGCIEVCTHGRALGCAWAEPTKGGASCETVCGANQAVTPWPLDAMAAGSTCAAIEAVR